jgi:hypothetical protein
MPACCSGRLFITSPSIRTDSAMSWYSWIMLVIWTSREETREASMLKAIGPPTVIVPANTSIVPSQMIVTVISFSVSPMIACVVVEIFSTSKPQLHDVGQLLAPGAPLRRFDGKRLDRPHPVYGLHDQPLS